MFGLAEVIRCFWCGQRKNDYFALCENCHRFPPIDRPKEE